MNSAPNSTESDALLRSAREHERAGNITAAEADLAKARIRHPNSHTVAWQWARISTLGSNHGEAIDRLETVLTEMKGDAPWRLYTTLAKLYRQSGNYRGANSILIEGRGHHPDVAPLALEWARLPSHFGNGAESIARAKELLEAEPFTSNHLVTLELTRQQERMGHIGEAAATIRVAAEENATDPVIAAEAASTLARTGDLHGAVANLQALVQQEAIDDYFPCNNRTFRSLSRSDWKALSETFQKLTTSPQVATSLAWFLSLWQERSGDCQGALATLEQIESVDRTSTIDSRMALLKRNRVADYCCDLSTAGGAYREQLADSTDDSAAVRDALLELSAEQLSNPMQRKREETFRISHATIQPNSIFEIAANTYRLDEAMLATLCSALTEAPTSTDRRLHQQIAQTTIFSASFADAHSSRLGIPRHALQQATFALAQREFDVLEPIRAVARHLSQHIRDTPVFFRVYENQFRYLQPANESSHLLYLIVEMARCGASVVLYSVSDAVGQAEKQVRQVDMVPGLSSLSEPTVGVLPESEMTHSPNVLIAAHMRQAERIASELPSFWLLETIHLTSPLSHSTQSADLPGVVGHPDFSIHAPRALLPTFRISMRHIPRSSSSASPDLHMSVSDPITNDFTALLRLALGRSFRAMWKNAVDAVKALGLTDAHTCDALTVDSAFVEAAVRARNGRVHLYPHSANPNLPAVRRSGSVTSVAAATRAGCNEWQRHHPTATIRLRPETSLPTNVTPVNIGRTQCTTVVVLGTSSHRYLRPILPVREYERLMASAFESFRDLNLTNRYRFIFKPKVNYLAGNWLESFVSDPFWAVSQDHALSLDDPNPVFVSIGFGSTALIEGALRGAPGLFIPLNAENDYMSIDPEIFGRHSVESATDVLIRLVSSVGYKRHAERQLARLAGELGGEFVRSKASRSRVRRAIRGAWGRALV